IPDDLVLVTVLPFGYRPDGLRGGRRRARKALSEMAHDGKFGRPYPEG
ncbi:MAG: hypothetical protein IIC24_06825, partial [Chloroflexi bacterium]|nr:hypothetical protein [Chloroflexota bacterium]